MEPEQGLKKWMKSGEDGKLPHVSKGPSTPAAMLSSHSGGTKRSQATFTAVET